MTTSEEENNAINDTQTPLTGEIEENFGGLEEEHKKKIRNQILLWGGVCLGVIAIVTIIIVLILTKGGDSSKDSEDGGGGKKPDEDGKGTDEVSPDVYGNIIAVYDVKKGNVKLLSDDFEKTFEIIMYVGDEKKDY